MIEEPTPKNASAVALGRMGKGVPKTLSAEQREKRRALMVAINQRRKALSTITTENDKVL